MNKHYYPVVIALGSNLGNKRENLLLAVRTINLQHCKISPFYHNEALLPPQAEDSWNLPFLNAAIAGYTDASPWQLLDICQKIELSMGRLPLNRRKKWAPRIIDLDIIFYSSVLIRNGILQQGFLHSHQDQHMDLNIPHPLFSQRQFVMQPLQRVAHITWIECCKAMLEPTMVN